MKQSILYSFRRLFRLPCNHKRSNPFNNVPSRLSLPTVIFVPSRRSFILDAEFESQKLGAHSAITWLLLPRRTQGCGDPTSPSFLITRPIKETEIRPCAFCPSLYDGLMHLRVIGPGVSSSSVQNGVLTFWLICRNLWSPTVNALARTITKSFKACIKGFSSFLVRKVRCMKTE